MQLVKTLDFNKCIYKWTIKVYEEDNHYPHCIYERIINEYGKKYWNLYTAIADLIDEGVIIRSNIECECPLQADNSKAMIEVKHYNMIKKRFDS